MNTDASPVLSEAQRGYLAGLLDGEGWLGIGARKRVWKRCTLPHYHRPNVTIGQSKWPIIAWLRDIVGTRESTIDKSHGVTAWQFRIHPSAQRWLLPQVLPHLILKQRQAEILIEFLTLCRYQGRELTLAEWQKREDLRVEIMSLNARPNPGRSKKTQ